MTENPTSSYTSFDGHRRIASGDLHANVLAVKRAAQSNSPGPVLTFDDSTGRVVDIDLRETDVEALAHDPRDAAHSQGSEAEAAESLEARGRGRPKLGVIAREVTLLPRHWDWLKAQPGGASVTLRKLIEDARRANVDRDRQRQAQERAYHVMSAMAGNMVGFEEAARALFAGDSAKFHQQTEAWPADVRDYLRRLAFDDN
jgi:uncharacterized protein